MPQVPASDACGPEFSGPGRLSRTYLRVLDLWLLRNARHSRRPAPDRYPRRACQRISDAFAFSGDRWVARTSASILQSADLGELIGQDLEDYISLAIRLANSRDRLLDLRRNMRSRLGASRVCDTEGFARNMERLYEQMFFGSDRHHFQVML